MGSISFMMSFVCDELDYLTTSNCGQLYVIQRIDGRHNPMDCENVVGQFVAEAVRENSFGIDCLKRKGQDVLTNVKKMVTYAVIYSFQKISLQDI